MIPPVVPVTAAMAPAWARNGSADEYDEPEEDDAGELERRRTRTRRRRRRRRTY